MLFFHVVLILSFCNFFFSFILVRVSFLSQKYPQHDREELECTADSDCKCTYQKCVQGKCNVPYSNLGECFAQCFRKQVDKQVLEHLKKEFEVSPTDGDDKFEAAFITHMTEETCIGDRQWEEGIGENREEWRCDTLCTKQNLCHSHDVIHAYQDQCYQNLHHSLHRDTCDVWSSKTACALASNYAPGYTTTAEDRPANEDGSSNGFECKVTKTDDTAPTLPCDCDHCYKPCNSKPHCEAAGGEYFYHETDEAGKPVHDHGQCCPAGAFVHSNKENSPGQSEAVIRSDCKPYAPGTPPRWTMQNEMCCVNSGGSWKTGGNKYDSCCFGEWEEKVKADGSIEFRCDEWVDTHKPCDECRQKNCPYSECSACEKARENCCGPTLLYANKTACLLHESCNDGSVEHQIRMYNNNEGNELERDRGIATCGNYKAPAGKEDSVTYLYDDQPMCAECWGPHCDRRTEVARCILEEITDPSGLDLFGAKIRIDEDICENKLGRTWISHGWGNHGNCMDRDATDEADCYRRNIQANKETFTFTSTGTYTMAIGKTVTQNGNVVGVLGVALGGTAAEDIIVVAQAGAALTTTDALTLDAAGTNVAVQASDLTAVNSVLGETVSAAAATLACNDRTMLTDWQKQQIEDATGLARSHADFPTPTVIRTEGRCEIQCSVEPDGGTTGTTCNDHANFHYQAGDRKMCALKWGQSNPDVACRAASGQIVSTRVSWTPRRYATEQECDNGECEGSLGNLQWWASFSKSDCETHSRGACNRNCKKCISTGKYEDGLTTLTLSVTSSQATSATSTTLTHVASSRDLVVGDVVTVSGHTGDAANLAMNQAFTVASVTSSTIAVLTGTGMTIGTYNTGTISGAVAGSWTGSYPTAASANGGHRDSDQVFRHQENGACFDRANLLKTEDQFHYRDGCEGNTNCDSGNCKWWSCEDQKWKDTDCGVSSEDSNTGQLPAMVQAVLKCSLGGPITENGHTWVEHGQCPDQETCELAGECDGKHEWQSSEKCTDADWMFGQRCWGEEEEIVTKEETVGNTQQTITVTTVNRKHKRCGSCKRSDKGLCYASTGSWGRNTNGDCDAYPGTASFPDESGHWLRHPGGCKVEGYYEAEADCLAAKTWTLTINSDTLNIAKGATVTQATTNAAGIVEVAVNGATTTIKIHARGDAADFTTNDALSIGSKQTVTINPQDITESVGVLVKQGSATGVLRTALTGTGMITVEINVLTGTFALSKPLKIGYSTVVKDNVAAVSAKTVAEAISGGDITNAASVTAGFGWASKLDTQVKCEAVKGCKDPFESHFNSKSQTTCSSCSGSWEPRFKWHSGEWLSGKTKPYKWVPEGVKQSSTNSWLPSISERKMRAALAVPVMKMFAETKKTQSLMEYNSFNGPLSKIACDCGEEERTDCWPSDPDYEGGCCDDPPLVGVGEAFCNDDEDSVVQGGSQSVSIRKTCPVSSGGRRLSGAVSSNMAFDTITAGDFASKMCTNERNQGGTHVSTKCDCPTDGQLDTMVVKNSVGTVIGQLVGDGTGIRTTTGTFPDEVSTCMTFRSDIYMNNDLFDT